MSDAAKLIFFSHSRIMFHVFFSLFFSYHTPHCTVWHIFPTDNSCMASSCIPQSILLPPTINPTVSHNQSYCLQQSILQPPTINPPTTRHILSPLLYGFPSLCAVICHAVTPHPGDYLFSDICPPQHESPVCQYGPSIRQ